MTGTTHPLAIVILLAHTKRLEGGAFMKPELRRVVLGLVLAGFAFAVVLAITRIHPANDAAPGLNFISPGISRK